METLGNNSANQTKLYLAGPMRGYPAFNFPAFHKAAKELRALGFEVWSPAEHDVEADGFDPIVQEHNPNLPPKTFAHYMERDLPAVCQAHAVAVLEGWDKSEGARLEVHVARAIGKQIIWASDQRFVQFKDATCAMLGEGGAPVRATTLPQGAKERKEYPVASGVLDYFPDALACIAHVSWKGNEQHNPGKSLRWDRSKSCDEADTLARHFLQRGTVDSDGIRHTAKMAWRALALLQKELEQGE